MEQVLNSDRAAMGAAGRATIKNTYALPIVMNALTRIYGRIL
jgi:hypothetical protein